MNPGDTDCPGERKALSLGKPDTPVGAQGGLDKGFAGFCMVRSVVFALIKGAWMAWDVGFGVHLGVKCSGRLWARVVWCESLEVYLSSLRHVSL